MPLLDMSIEELRGYRPPLTQQADFDEYWRRTLVGVADIPLDPVIESVGYPVDGPSFNTVTYSGWRGARINGWYVLPPGRGPFPLIVSYHGYSGNRGTMFSLLPWVCAGYAVLAVDTRGQNGDSSDPGPYSSGHYRGYMTQGILDPEEYYYRGVYVDCIRALDFAEGRPEIDGGRVGVTGSSQGGGLALAVAALDRRSKAAIARVPFLCHFRRALDVTDQHPYWEIAEFCNAHPEREQIVFRTLSYFDNLNLAGRIACPTLVTLGLQDMICPPSTIFATYNQMACQKDILVYPYMGHGDSPAQWEKVLQWLHEHVSSG